MKLQARELGADIAYCLRKAARVRNERISKGHKRLVRLAGLPLSRVHKQRMLLSPKESNDPHWTSSTSNENVVKITMSFASKASFEPQVQKC